jgi:kynureninase
MKELSEIKKWDAEDPLARYRSHFVHGQEEIYMDGNSLGKLPLETKKKMEETLSNAWGKRLIRSWNEDWLELPLRLAAKYASLLNAAPEELLIGESTSVRLFQIVQALLQLKKYPLRLVTDSLNFPTDNYILEGLAEMHSKEAVYRIDYPDEINANLDHLKKAFEEKPGIYCLSLVSYKSAFLYPMKTINQWAAAHDSIIVWDLSHAVGAVAIDLKAAECKVALGCSYKYLNGGPGAPAFLYVTQELYPSLKNPIQGWFGHQSPFEFDPKYTPAEGIQRFAVGTPPVLSLQAMESGVDITLQAGIKNIRAKSIKQTELFIQLFKEKLKPLGFQLESPEDSQIRGSHVTLSHTESWRICQALLQGIPNGPVVIPDFRPPRFIRFGIAPLYTRFEEIYTVVHRLEQIVHSQSYLQFDQKKPTVT